MRGRKTASRRAALIDERSHVLSSGMHPRYEEWLTFVFDHEPGTDWEFEIATADFHITEEESVDLMTLTFARSGADLACYSDAQVNEGLYFIVDPGKSDWLFGFESAAVPLTKRTRGIQSIYNLYADCFGRRCTDTLGHLSEGGSDLNEICYMFWDICPLIPPGDNADQNALGEAVVSVLEQTLHLPHRACREAALHGMGHLAYWFSARVQKAIDEILCSGELDPALQSYALSAREGMVN